MLRTAAQCHSRGIIFRDIKPDNFLFLTPAPNAPLKATDFGLAGKLPPEGERLTRRCGTPSYMAPEVINRSYGAEADVWSCGVVAYQLLTGRLPFIDVVNPRPNAKEVRLCMYMAEKTCSAISPRKRFNIKVEIEILPLSFPLIRCFEQSLKIR